MKKPLEYSDAANRFGKIAKQYCALVDSAPVQDKTEFLLGLYRMLPDLIAEAIRLPQVEFDDEEDEEREAIIRQIRADTEMKHDEWNQLYDSLKQKLGNWDLYWEVFDPRTDHEAIHGSLADDIADIYRELKDGLRVKESSEVPDCEFVFDWRLGFFTHWGHHAIDALRAIHFWLEGTV